MKNITLLGSTGSIGVQTLDVARSNPDKFNIVALSANNNSELLIKQALEFNPDKVVITNESKYKEVKEALSATDIDVTAGDEALADVAAYDKTDIVLTALVGYSGLIPTIRAIEAKKDIALANKETLVVAGEIVMNLAQKHGIKIYPVDSEHSAVFQCLTGENYEDIEKLILTASGGPFRGKSKNFIQSATRVDALKHPNWDMGAKITIDSASLMNKGFEVIEAKWLFGLSPDKIDVVVHPQSIIHSMVQFKDSSIKAQMGLPDMKLPILYALSYPERVYADFERLNFADYATLTFENPDTDLFPNLDLAYFSMKKGGNTSCILNAANEIVVDAFLKDRVGFTQMSDLIKKSLEKISFIQKPSLEDYICTDKETRDYTKSLI